MAATVGLAGCGHDCTLVGCVTGLTVSTSMTSTAIPASIRACVEQTCATTEFSRSAAVFDQSIRNAGTHQVTITFRLQGDPREHRFAEPVEFPKAQPNGAQCEPTCYVARVEIADDGSLAVLGGGSLSSLP